MKSRARLLLLPAFLPLVSPLCLAPGLLAAPAPTNVSHKTAPPSLHTNAAPEAVAGPLSVFTIPATPHDGRDPFFPDSTRPFTALQSRTNTNKTAAVGNLAFKGLAGPPNHRLATINTTVFETGEEKEVVTSTGRVRVRCLEITDDAVLIEIGSERRVLPFTQGK